MFAGYSRRELFGMLDAAGIAFGNINDVSDLGRHPSLVRKDVRVGDDVVSLVRRSGDASKAAAPVPALGEHGIALRAEFG